MKAYVVTEREREASILRAVLPRELLAEIGLVPGAERSNCVSIARTLLVTRHKPLAILVSSRSVDEKVIREKRQITRELLDLVASGVTTQVIVLVPYIEIVFFQAPGVLEKVFGGPIPRETLLISRAAPNEALSELLARKDGPRTMVDLLDALSDDEIESLRATGPIRELIEFVAKVTGPQSPSLSR